MRLRHALIVKYLGNRTRCTSPNACRGSAKYKDRPVNKLYIISEKVNLNQKKCTLIGE